MIRDLDGRLGVYVLEAVHENSLIRYEDKCWAAKQLRRLRPEH